MANDPLFTGIQAWQRPIGLDDPPFFGLDRSEKLLRGWDSPAKRVAWWRALWRMVTLHG